MRIPRRLRRAVIGTILLTICGEAHADSRPEVSRKGVHLAWVRGIDTDRCVGQFALEEDVKARLGYDPFRDAPDLAISGAVLRTPRGYRVELVVRDEAGAILGSRQLASNEPDCRSLGEATAVAITVAIDPEATGERSPSSVELSSFVSVEPSPPRPSAPPPSSPREPQGRASLSAGGALGLVPNLSPGVALRALGRVHSHVELGIGAHFWPESRVGDELSFALSSLAAEGCFVPRPRAAIRWCAAAHVGLFHVFVARGALVPIEVGMFPWAAVDTGPALSIPLLGPLRLDLGVSALVPVIRRQAFLRGQSSPAWEQAIVGGRAEVGVGTSL